MLSRYNQLFVYTRNEVVLGNGNKLNRLMECSNSK